MRKMNYREQCFFAGLHTGMYCAMFIIIFGHYVVRLFLFGE